VSLTAILLALSSTVRPTSLAAVTALLVTSRPQRLLLLYILAGLVVSVAIGVLVVSLLHQLAAKHPKGHAGVEIGLGVIVLAAAAYLTIRERRHPRGGDRPPGKGEDKLAKRLRNHSVVAAGAAGIITHSPGPFYLAALDAIISTKPGFLDGVAQVLVYNLIWFAMPIAAFVLSIEDEQNARIRIDAVGAWARRHERVIGPLLLAAVGTYLVVKGLTKL
jgi:hypothetical protein